ncbi:transglutaminase domain-containing protein [Gordonia sp. zg691]|uniref:Transglutaminase domain-containing protein n=1 Tax=Gordonia jinghuaiqii TaxID=2758710 RepID=A0A7D7LU28_9ACTN|nr:transglutaminase domain-containing protein [Gordonia jinghuaiqii]MBD0861660.1 transglutaminase domain-containing protein [Gordonia jinghuaiqii]MCR5977553.1 transglutaminase [Gordonia jinghuaiqii]QMT02237.1 transglutaminase domain-containing protein [Gordonia jinghuaiqii]
MTPRDVSARLEVRVDDPTELEMQIAVAKLPGLRVEEELKIEFDGRSLTPEEIIAPHGSRIHRLRLDRGLLTIDYWASVLTPADPLPVDVTDRSIYLRPSRYAECDKFFGFAAGQFDFSLSDGEILNQVAEFVSNRLSYIPGTSDPIDGAADTLLAGAGVCRDYAHLVVALLRALNIPARLVAVYAPGCSPMDFHAVAEAIVDGEWVAVDATGLAPRQSLVRISTGRDAADTAFLDNHRGSISLNSYEVTATVRGNLPYDDGSMRVKLG